MTTLDMAQQRCTYEQSSLHSFASRIHSQDAVDAPTHPARHGPAPFAHHRLEPIH